MACQTYLAGVVNYAGNLNAVASAAGYIRMGAYICMFMKGCSGAWVNVCRHSFPSKDCPRDDIHLERKCHNYRLVILAIFGKLSQDTVWKDTRNLQERSTNC